MPNDPVDGLNPEDDAAAKLRRRLEAIEDEVGRTPEPSTPSQDAIRAGIQQSPIESQIEDTDFHVRPGQDVEHRKPDDELSEEERQLREFDERLKAARAGAMPEPPEWNFQRPNIPGQNKAEENNYFGMGVGISIAYTLVGATFAGWGIGKLIDMKSGGTMGQAIGTLCGAVAGLAAAIFTIIRAQNKPGNK